MITPAARRVAVPVALLAGYAVVQFLYLRPPSSRDGITYFNAAHLFPDIGADHRTLRIGLLAPVRLFQEVFGVSEAAYYAVPLLAGAGLILGTFWIGRHLFGAAVGVGAALVLMLSEPFLETSSLLLPDHVSAALFVAGLAVVLSVAKRRAGAPPAAFARRDHLLLIAAGLLFGWAYLAREYVPFLFPLVLLVFHLDRLPWRKLAWVAAPAAGILVGEVVTNAIVHGSPFERFTASGGHGGQRDYITDSRLDALVRLPDTLLETPGGFVLAAALFATVAAVVIRQREFRLIVAWFALFWIPLTLGTGLLVPDFRLLIADKLRYWMPAFPAVAIGGVAAAQFAAARIQGWARHRRGDGSVEAVENGEDRRTRAVPAAVALATAAALAVVGFSRVADGDSYLVNGADQLGDLRAWLAGDGSGVDVVWTDRYTARLLPLYSRSIFGDRLWDGEVRTFHGGEGRDDEFVDRRELTEGAIVLYRFGYRILPDGYEGIPTYLRRREGPDRTLEVFRDDRSLVIIRLDG